MIRDIPPLEPVETPGGLAYQFADVRAFRYELWVPTLLGIHKARTIGEQREAITEGVLWVGGSRGFRSGSKGRKVMWLSGGQARIKLDTPQPELSFLRISKIEVGYITPDRDYSTSFAVVEQKDTDDKGKPKVSYHEAFKSASGRLGTVERKMGALLVTALGDILDNRYPGFELFAQLAEHGVSRDADL